MHATYLDSIKSFEGFTARAKWDYAQNSNGYGTKALFPGESINRAEAQRRFEEEISRARQYVERQAGGLDEGTKAALTSLTFNAGTRWASSGLGAALRNGDLVAAKEHFLKYNKAGGEELPGLLKRRTIEASWIGNPPTSATSSDAGSEPPSTIAEDAPPPVAPPLAYVEYRTALHSVSGRHATTASDLSQSDGPVHAVRQSATLQAIAQALLLLDMGLPSHVNDERDMSGNRTRRA